MRPWVAPPLVPGMARDLAPRTETDHPSQFLPGTLRTVGSPHYEDRSLTGECRGADVIPKGVLLLGVGIS